MKKITQALVTFFSNPRNVFILGMLVAITATALETFRGRCTNYYDYRDSTVDFFNGICVYTLDWVQAHRIYFLYTPNFNFLFAPVAYSPWWLGPFIWNLANYTLFFLSIWTLPTTGSRSSSSFYWFWSRASSASSSTRWCATFSSLPSL